MTDKAKLKEARKRFAELKRQKEAGSTSENAKNLPNSDEAVGAAEGKGRRVVSEQGSELDADGEPKGSELKEGVSDVSKPEESEPKGSEVKEGVSDVSKLEESEPKGSELKEGVSDVSKPEESEPKGSELKEGVSDVSKPEESEPKDSGVEAREPKDSEPQDSEPKDSKPKDSEPKDNEPKDSEPKDSDVKASEQNDNMQKASSPSIGAPGTSKKSKKKKKANQDTPEIGPDEVLKTSATDIDSDHAQAENAGVLEAVKGESVSVKVTEEPVVAPQAESTKETRQEESELPDAADADKSSAKEPEAPSSNPSAQAAKTQGNAFASRAHADSSAEEIAKLRDQNEMLLARVAKLERHIKMLEAGGEDQDVVLSPVVSQRKNTSVPDLYTEQARIASVRAQMQQWRGWQVDMRDWRTVGLGPRVRL